MKADLYSATVNVFDRGLIGLAIVLRKGMAHAADHGVAEAEVLAARLHPNMYPLERQVQIVCDFARQTPSRILDLEVPAELAGPMNHDELQAQISAARQFLAGLERARFEGRDELRITVPVSGQPMSFSNAGYLLGFATPNFYFHLVTAYGILRSRGVALGKVDYFGVGNS